MNININIIDRPMFTEFSLLAKPDINKLKESKEITVEGSFITKTRVNTQMQINGDRHGINLEIDGFKTDTVEEYSYFSGEHSYPSYFKKSKKQNVDAYINYVKEVIKKVLKDYLKVSLDEITINLILPNF